jgi:predicted DNA binding protein
MGLKYVRLAIEVPPTAWLRDLRKMKDVIVRIVDCVQHEDGSVTHLVSVTTPDRQTAQRVKQVLKSSKLVEEAFFIENASTNVIGYVKTKRCTLCGIVANRCFVRRGVYDVQKERIVWRVLAHDREIPSLIDALKMRGASVELLESVEVKDLDFNGSSSDLLLTALEEGYFDVPRRVSTNELARRLGKSPATLSITLRRNVKKILKHYAMLYAS